MPTKSKTDHIVHSAIYSGEHVKPGVAGGELLCFHCGGRFMPTFPAPITIMLAVTQQFMQDHRHCEKTPRGAFLEEKHVEDWYQWNRDKRSKAKYGHAVVKLGDGYAAHTCCFGLGGEVLIGEEIRQARDLSGLLSLKPGGVVERRARLPEDAADIMEVWF